MKTFFLLGLLTMLSASLNAQAAYGSANQIVAYTGIITFTKKHYKAELSTPEGIINLIFYKFNKKLIPVKDGDLVTIEGYKIVPIDHKQLQNDEGFAIKVIAIQKDNQSYILNNNKK